MLTTWLVGQKLAHQWGNQSGFRDFMLLIKVPQLGSIQVFKLRIKHSFLCNENWIQFGSVIQLCLTLCNPMDCSKLGFPVHHQLPELMSIEALMPSNHLIPCCPLLLLPSIFPSIRVFSKESVLPIRWPKYWSFSLSISPMALPQSHWSMTVLSFLIIFTFHFFFPASVLPLFPLFCFSSFHQLQCLEGKRGEMDREIKN